MRNINYSAISLTNNRALKMFINHSRMLRLSIKQVRLLSIILILFLSFGEIYSQYYELTLNQRRKYDQIHVEIWARATNESAPKIGNSSLVLKYDSQYLEPSAAQQRTSTDSINFNIDVENPVDIISSNFNLSSNGYNSLTSQSYGEGYYSLEINLKNLGDGGFKPASNGKGSFVGKLSFTIIDDPDESALTGIEWSKNILPGKIQIFDIDSNDLFNDIVFTDPGDFPVIGVTLLSPNYDGQVVDRDQNYASLKEFYEGGGYPVYFERTVNPNDYESPAQTNAADEDIGYCFQYSINDGASWTEIGRAVETSTPANINGSNQFYRSGEIFQASTNQVFIITDMYGERIRNTNYRNPLRTIWHKGMFFTERSEEARLKVTMLDGGINTEIEARNKTNMEDMSDGQLILGRLFFLQLDGAKEYLKTPDNFSNSTQLTVSAWVNLNSYNAYGSEPAIVASTGGPDMNPINESREGAWMLYLKDGRIPAFRVREIQSRGEGGYLASLQAYYADSLSVTSDAMPLSGGHADNWAHLAATVNNNVVTLYVNGEIVDQFENNNSTDIRMLTTNHPLWFGINPNESIESDDYLNAGLKSVSVWKIALTPQEIRERIAGIKNPSDVSKYGDLRRGLIYYYSLEGTQKDLASDTEFQNGVQFIDYYEDGVKKEFTASFRPDSPHIKITSPTNNSGLSNLEGKEYDIRFASYGIGDINNTSSKDIEVEYSIDDGMNWFFVENPNGNVLGGESAPDVENGFVTWEPYENDNTQANLRQLEPYSKDVIIRLRGTETNSQNSLKDEVGHFKVAPYFSVKMQEGSILALSGRKGMNLTGNDAFMEAWVKPYRFPTEEEEFFPIISKHDSISNDSHYSLNLLPSGRLQLVINDINGNQLTATSDSTMPLLEPNSWQLDSLWSHIGVFVSLNGGNGPADVRFYIDGFVQRDENIENQLGEDVQIAIDNEYYTYIGYSPPVRELIPVVPAEGFIYGNLSSGMLEGQSASAEFSFYDDRLVEHKIQVEFVKTEIPDSFNVFAYIDNIALWEQSEQLYLGGNLDAGGAGGYTTQTVITDNSGNNHDFEISFAETGEENKYLADISINSELINQYNIIFNQDGSLSSPEEIEISAQVINDALGSNYFDELTPKNLTIVLTGTGNSDELTHLTGESNAQVWLDYDDMSFPRGLSFNDLGEVETETYFTVDYNDINLALGNNAFTGSTGRIKINYYSLNGTQTLSQKASPTSLSSIAGNGKSNAGSQDAIIEESRSFVGEIRDIRLWNGSPNGTLTSSSEPTDMTTFIQGALAVDGEELLPGYKTNLAMSYDFDGGSFSINHFSRAVDYSDRNEGLVRAYGSPVEFVPLKPYIKLVEPVFKQRVANSQEDVRVRWVGFNYNGNDFYTGSNKNQPPSLEFSIRGGGGQIIQPYQFLGSRYFAGNTKEALSFPDSSLFRFKGTGIETIFAAKVNAAISDPDENNDGTFNDQGPLWASLTNARFRLTGEYTVNGEHDEIKSEGPLFTVTPASNFTVRVLLEGYQNGNIKSKLITNLGNSFEEGGVKIRLYKDNSGGIGEFVDEALSINGYDDRNPSNMNGGNNRFGNVNFVFTDLTDGDYWVVVMHPNHLPVMSRFPAEFKYEGDLRSTWEIESGWDFLSWNGEDNNVLGDPGLDPWSGRYFTAAGYAYNSKEDNPTKYSLTGLIYNNGVAGNPDNPLPAMVAGDVDQSGQIDAADRVLSRLDAGTGLNRSDVTGDGTVNADDRTIVDRNTGKVSSLLDYNFPDSLGKAPLFPNRRDEAPFDVISDLAPQLSVRLNEAAKNINVNKIDLIKQKDKTLADFYYDVSAEPELNGNYVDVPIYIKNYSEGFNIANATFAITYNPSNLEFASLVDYEDNIYHDNPDIGYNPMKSAPEANASDPLPGVRTIEIDYDAYSNLGGAEVPYEKTHIGTLRFLLKNQSGVVVFDWHHATSIHTVEGEIITANGDFKVIEPVLLYDLTVKYPNGKEGLSPKKGYTITWESNGNAPVYIEFTKNAGVDWDTLTTEPIEASLESYSWTTPDITSNRCLIRILDDESGAELDRSDSMFSIMPDFALIIKPSKVDPVYRGGDDALITWISSGYQEFRFEFSSNAGSTWSSVPGIAIAANKQHEWKVPNETTRMARIRMLDNDTGEPLDTTSSFRILGGNMSFKAPRKGDDVPVGLTKRIRWSTYKVDLFDIDLSTDGGTTWDNIFINVNAADGYVNWDVPSNPAFYTDKAVLRAIWQGDPEMEYTRTERFNIVPSTSVFDEALPEGIIINTPAPNPAESKSKIEIKTLYPLNIDVSIMNNLGQKVYILHSGMISSGITAFDINCDDLSSGNYYIIFESPEFRHKEKLIIAK